MLVLVLEVGFAKNVTDSLQRTSRMRDRKSRETFDGTADVVVDTEEDGTIVFLEAFNVVSGLGWMGQTSRARSGGSGSL